MTNTFFISDTHFGHEGTACRFKRPDGTPLRPFKSVEEQDETLVLNWNTTVGPKDRVYHLGDFCMARKHLAYLHRLHGRIAIVAGNHDPWDLDTWRKYPKVDHVQGYMTYPKHGIICSHIPVHPNQLEGRFQFNVHGHLHAHRVMNGNMPDTRYINVAVEQINYTPISFDDLLKRCNE